MVVVQCYSQTRSVLRREPDFSFVLFWWRRRFCFFFFSFWKGRNTPRTIVSRRAKDLPFISACETLP